MCEVIYLYGRTESVLEGELTERQLEKLAILRLVAQTLTPPFGMTSGHVNGVGLVRWHALYSQISGNREWLSMTIFDNEAEHV